ncbi:hypothetical protein HK099_007708 [Clydaea vesicula]|uniref:Cyclin N-terminal domain-containing protein n=1 Tax=Clydaea vesicula TaxID=447962 RepID=A0AAD5TW54_9FUNG|nr:hypothetical protein HK099_007708 [Clydaea vesicula]KAJ3378899.1 hypothetical protein HDU92_007050 [Lobulomyces angularis]
MNPTSALSQLLTNDVLTSFFISEAVLKNLGATTKNLKERNLLAKFVLKILRSEFKPVPFTLITSLLYLARLSNSCSDKIQRGSVRLALNPFRSWIICLILADIFLCDKPTKMRDWSKVVGISAREILMMRCQCLNAISFELTISENVLKEWLNYLETSVIRYNNKGKIITKTPSQQVQQKYLEKKNSVKFLKLSGVGNDNYLSKSYSYDNTKRKNDNLELFNKYVENLTKNNGIKITKELIEQHSFVSDVMNFTDENIKKFSKQFTKAFPYPDNTPSNTAPPFTYLPYPSP